ncbi:hypothetical protein [Lacrimispora defluvii]|uniref:DUF5071 domain-containing protein n=1 Tax=Lacrimispora defluvii TaxID=2719233 RepID=A0ABX1VL86_9FIRM|nr:hypothetical protein [Lacrimispora defluvii]NNJ28507.1 hypothetical protein [Lacrimispora defluvii]
MTTEVDKLLKLHEYDIYNNESINPDKLCQLGKCFSKENIDILKYFSYNKFSTKFCWLNPILIIYEMRYPQKLKCLSWLFGLLQDVNWPVYQEVIHALMSFDKRDVVSVMEKCLQEAKSHGDVMWISGMYMAAQELIIGSCDFQNKEIYQIFYTRDL